MEKRSIIALIVLIVGILILVAVEFMDFNKLFIKNQEEITQEPTGVNETNNYDLVLSRIELGNKWVTENDANDECSSFRYYHRGCYYKQYLGLETGAITGGNLQNHNLTHSEIIDLCQKLAHKGEASFCLRSNNEKALCLNFAEDNEYLNAICELDEGKVLPVEFNNGQEYCSSNKCYPFMKYSEIK